MLTPVRNFSFAGMSGNCDIKRRGSMAGEK